MHFFFTSIYPVDDHVINFQPYDLNHKNGDLALYLDLISYNIHEKIGILPYILKNSQGTYLEIGTGGDPIAEMFKQIPDALDIVVIASDIDKNVLDALPLRHPSIAKYLSAVSGPRLHLVQLDATDLSMFKNNFFDGINASSLVHEIISYAGGFTALDIFFREISRVLKLGGVFVYRDPESFFVNNENVSLLLKSRNLKLFAHIFFAKFLDKKGSLLAENGRKFCMYRPEDLFINFFKKESSELVTVDYNQYMKLPTQVIDFSRQYTLTLPYGLYREFARHYVTYLHQCNPLTYVKCLPDILSENYLVNYFAHSTPQLFVNFLNKNNGCISYGRISQAQKRGLDKHVQSIAQVIQEGILIQCNNDQAEAALCRLLERYGFESNNYIIRLDSTLCLLDYRLFGLLYDQLNKDIFSTDISIVHKEDEIHAQWLKREGEESYFYLSTDDLIARVLLVTQQSVIDEMGNKRTIVLAPLAADKNIFVERICYTELLNQVLDAHDLQGHAIDIIDGKRVIHFGKMYLEDAVVVCEEIIALDPSHYPSLKESVDRVKNDVH